MRYIRLRSLTRSASTSLPCNIRPKKLTKSRNKHLKTYPHIIQVGKTRWTNPKTGLEAFYKYSDIPKDAEGWVSDLRYLPISFDMMQVKIKDNPKIIPGWWDGEKWTGLRFRQGYIVTQWKRDMDYDRIEHYGEG